MKKLLSILVLSCLLLLPNITEAVSAPVKCMAYSDFREKMKNKSFELDKYFLDNDSTLHEFYSQAKGSKWILVVITYNSIRLKYACLENLGDFQISAPTSSY